MGAKLLIIFKMHDSLKDLRTYQMRLKSHTKSKAEMYRKHFGQEDEPLADQLLPYYQDYVEVREVTNFVLQTATRDEKEELFAAPTQEQDLPSDSLS